MAKRVKHGKAYNIGQGMVRIVGNNPNITDGVSIGANTSDNLQVDNDEVLVGVEASKSGKTLYPIDNNIKVLSAQPMLGGVSPVQLLYGGMSFDEAFAVQEKIKDIHGINDDGSRQRVQFGIRKRFQGGGEDKNEKPKKRNAIAYGDNTSTRLRYLNLDKKLTAYINHVATQYGISPAVLASRLSSEGIVDSHIKYLDNNRDKKGISLLEHIYSSGYMHYGLDDIFSLYKKGKLNLRRKIPFQKDINVNEHNRVVHSVQVRDPYDGIELMAANLEYLGKEIKNKFPNLKNKDLDTAIAKAYNMGLYGAINDISKNGIGNKYKINDGYYNINYNNDIYLQNKDKIYNINKFTIDEQNDEINNWADVYSSRVDDARKYNNAQIYPTEDFQKEWARKHAIKSLTEGDYQFAYPIGTTDYTYNNPFANVNFSFKFGGQTNINSLGERPNAKYGKQMKNKRNKAVAGTLKTIADIENAKKLLGKNYNFFYNDDGSIKRDIPTFGSLSGVTLGKDWIAPMKSLMGEGYNSHFTPTNSFVQGVQSITPNSINIGTKPFVDKYGTTISPNGSVVSLKTPDIKLSPNNANDAGAGNTGNIGSNASATKVGVVTSIVDSLGAIGASLIQQNAINNRKSPTYQYTLLDPVKLKTKINIAPQIARMKEMRAKLQDAAIRTSGSSRDAYSRILAGHNNLLQSAMNLYAQQENIETELINRDRLNQQGVAHANAKNVMDAINNTNAARIAMGNKGLVDTSNNWTSALNSIRGSWLGPEGFVDRENARMVKAADLYTQAIANPDAAKLIYGNIDFTTDANKRKAFNTIYNFLNNNRLG